MKICGKAILTIIVTVLIAALCATAADKNFAYAAVKDSEGLKSYYSTGAVDISVDVYTINNGKETLLNGKNKVALNGNMSYIPRITNHAESCYVRVRLTAKTDTQNIAIIKDLYGVEREWKKIGEYLYYTKPLDRGKSVDICRGFYVPEDWNYMQSNDMRVKITADAIQSKNFKPDFDSERPWHNTVITESYIDDDYTVNNAVSMRGTQGIKLVCINSKGDIEIDSDTLFRDRIFMPGDEYTEAFTITNMTKKEADIMFRAEFEESHLLNMLKMRIDKTDSGETFYNGSAAGESLREAKQIMRIAPGESRTIHVTLKLPEEAGNNYQANEDSATWYFTLAEDETNVVNTGDIADNYRLCLSSLVCIVICVFSAIIVIRRMKND